MPLHIYTFSEGYFLNYIHVHILHFIGSLQELTELLWLNWASVSGLYIILHLVACEYTEELYFVFKSL